MEYYLGLLKLYGKLYREDAEGYKNTLEALKVMINREEKRQNLWMPA